MVSDARCHQYVPFLNIENLCQNSFWLMPVYVKRISFVSDFKAPKLQLPFEQQ